jgi:hypothetical protein
MGFRKAENWIFITEGCMTLNWNILKLAALLTVPVFLSSCPDQFEVRTGIDGCWRIESIRLSSPGLNDPHTIIRPDFILDSLILPANGFIHFERCRSRENREGCRADVSLMEHTLDFRYFVRGNQVSFEPNLDGPGPGLILSEQDIELRRRLRRIFMIVDFEVSGDFDSSISLRDYSPPYRRIFFQDGDTLRQVDVIAEIRLARQCN